MKKKKKSNIPVLKFNAFEFIPQAKLDYHEFGILNAYDIEKHLNEFIEDSYISKFTEILIITGKGFVVRPLVNKLLSKNKYVLNFKSAGYFNGQGGAFEVKLTTSNS